MTQSSPQTQKTTQSSMREQIIAAMNPDGNKALVFISDTSAGCLAMYVHASGTAMTYSVNKKIINQELADAIAEGTSYTADWLISTEGFYTLVADSVAAAANGAYNVPGISLAGASTGSLMDNAKEFAAANKVSDVRTVYAKRSKNIAWRWNKEHKPQRVPHKTRNENAGRGGENVQKERKKSKKAKTFFDAFDQYSDDFGASYDDDDNLLM